MSERLTHNVREQRRARRINDKIMQLKGFMEVRLAMGLRSTPNRPTVPALAFLDSCALRLQFQGRNFRSDKFSILDTACSQLQFLYELVVELGTAAGWENPAEGTHANCACIVLVAICTTF